MKMLKRFLPTLLAVLMWLSIPVARATESPPLQLTASTRHASLSGYLAEHVDAPGDLTFDQATQAGYEPLKNFRSAGYTPDTYWYRFTLTRDPNAQREWVLAMGMPYLDDVCVWILLADGKFREYQMGDHFAYENRPLQSRMFALRLDLHDTMPISVYVRVHSISAINFSAEVWQPDAFIADETRMNFYSGVYFGVLGIIVVLYLLLGAWLRDGGMVIYASYVATLFLLYLGVNGYVAVLFAPTTSWVADAVTGIGVIGFMGIGTLIWSLLLNLKRHFPRIRYLYLSNSIACACALPFVTSSYYRIIAPVLLQAGVVVVVSNMVLLMLLWRRQRSLELLIYLFAFSFTTLAALSQTSMAMGWLQQSWLASNIRQLSSLLTVLVMNFGLAIRMRQIQHEKALAEQEAAVTAQRAEAQRNFVAMLSHEFRNPLAAIDRAAQMILLKLPSMPPAEAERMANIRTGVGSLSSLVDNFLTSEALDHQALALSIENCPIRPLLEGVVQTLGETIGERVLLTVMPPEATFLFDQTLIGMAVGNLLGNALRYSPADKKVELSAIVDDDGLVIRVTDHGSGLSQEELAMLGMPYYRASSSVGKKGSGLGYHFSRRIVEAHGGSLQADCPPHKGLEVAIWLPAADK